MCRSWLSIALVAALGACSDSPSEQPDAGFFSEPTHEFVIDSLFVPDDVSVPIADSFDLDEADEETAPDNLFAILMGLLAETLDVQGVIDRHLANGDTLMLARLQAEVLTTTSSAGLWLYLGANPSVTPCADPGDAVCGRHLAGGVQFDVRDGAPTDSLLVGRIIGGRFDGGPDPVTIELSLVENAAPVQLSLIGARMEVGEVGEDTLRAGMLGGGIPAAEIDSILWPAVYAEATAVVDRDCPNTAPPCCEVGSTGEILIDLYDDDDDCRISEDELRDNDLLRSLLVPDMDLLDCPAADSPPEDCEYRPNTDGVRDTMSLGLAFTAVSAEFD